MEPEDAERVIANVGRRIAELRASAGRTQAEIAEAVGMTLPNYQRVEYGLQNLTLRTMVRLAAAIGAPVAELLTSPTTTRAGRGRPSKTEASAVPSRRTGAAESVPKRQRVSRR